MFQQLPRPGSRGWSAGTTVSFAAHLALLFFLLHLTAPRFLSPSEVDLGIPHSFGSRSITYLAPLGPERAQAPAEQHRVLARKSVPRAPQPPKTAKRKEPPAHSLATAPDATARGGSPFGHVPGSPLTGDEVIPSYPVVFPDPPVSRADLPQGVQGDVIVEVTIDSAGNVIATKLLHGIGYGIEQKVLDVLPHWHFHPAVRDGVTIASQQLLYFHYPS